MPEAEPRVSVVVAVRDGAGVLPGLLDALAAQTLDGVEVLVVDDGSADATRAVAAARPGVHLLATGRRAGAYAARNLGLAAARAPVVAITDADCRPAPDWLERGVAALAHADLVAGAVQAPLGPAPGLAEAIDAACGIDQAAHVASGFAATANLLAARDAFERVGLFNPRLRSGGDAEWTQRAVAAGLTLRYAPEVRVAHEPRRQARALAAKAWRVGRGVADLRRVGAGPAATRPAAWSDRRLWRPQPALPGLERLQAQGYTPGRARRLALRLAHHVWVQLPTLAGDAAATAVAARPRR